LWADKRRAAEEAAPPLPGPPIRTFSIEGKLSIDIVTFDAA
jgi:hypothetical protein